ncbi:MAG: hypothetical protein AAB728_00995 [Patescibacteria group bacterium]
MNTITLQDIKKRGAKAIPEGKIVYLIVNSKVKAALVPPRELDMLIEAFEDLEDLKAIEEYERERANGERMLTWEEVFPEDKK